MRPYVKRQPALLRVGGRGTCHSCVEFQFQIDPGAHWTASLVEMMNGRFIRVCQRLVVKSDERRFLTPTKVSIQACRQAQASASTHLCILMCACEIEYTERNDDDNDDGVFVSPGPIAV